MCTSMKINIHREINRTKKIKAQHEQIPADNDRWKTNDL